LALIFVPESGGMAVSLKQNLISALTSEPVRWVNFEYKNWWIGPQAFYILAGHVYSGIVNTKIDRSITGRMAFYDQFSNTVIASDPSFGDTYWDEKALLIHESAHAILDVIYAGRNSSGVKQTMTVADHEAIGYLAGAFYLVAANAAGMSQVAPEREALKLARSKLSNRPPWTGTLVFRFTAQELQPLRSAIINSPLYRNSANAIAPNNG
jgi:hypothetical protein